MPKAKQLTTPLGVADIVAVANGSRLLLSAACRERVCASRRIVEGLVLQGIRGYGINTGVGALCDVIIDRSQQQQLSLNLLRSTAVGVGPLLSVAAMRAIMAASVNNYAHGYSGVRIEVVEQLLALLNSNCTPEVPSDGSVGYLTHMAHVALVLVGEGRAQFNGRSLSGAEALQAIGLEPLVLEAKEGLSLINGTPCATGLACLALDTAARLLDWADVAGAQTFENIGCQLSAFAEEPLSWRASPGLMLVGQRLRHLLASSGVLEARRELKTQDALSLRAMPHVHGAARDVWETTQTVVTRELNAATDNPLVSGDFDNPRVHSQAHAVGAALALALDSLGIAMASVAAISERRTDRLLNPQLSGLPAFLSGDAGVVSGLMIAQYTASSLTAQNRRLAAPASLDGGVTSAMQEDHLCHATPAALKALDILGNTQTILAIEIFCATQAADLQPAGRQRSPMLELLYRSVRFKVPFYFDQRPLHDEITQVRELLNQPVSIVIPVFQ